MHDAHTRNLLGASALTISDLLLAGVTVAGGVSASGAAALVVVSASPGLSVTELGRRVGLSQSAAARMVDGLVDRGLVRRQTTPSRSVAVHPTTEGTATVERVLHARDDVLAALIRPLDEPEQRALRALLGKLLGAVYEQVSNSALLCRLCDRAGCVADDQICPVGQAERDGMVLGDG